MRPPTIRSMNPQKGLALARRQRGATAVEFALVFPLFFTIVYMIITFSLMMVAQQNLTLAAEEGARAALNYQPNTSLQSALTNRAAAACVGSCLPTAAPPMSPSMRSIQDGAWCR